MRFLQILILSILIGNGLQPLLTDALPFEQVLTEIVDCDDSASEEEGPRESSSSSKGLQESEDTVYQEPKPNDLETNNNMPVTGIPSHLKFVAFVIEDWQLIALSSVPRIAPELKEHLHYSKSPSDTTQLS